MLTMKLLNTSEVIQLYHTHMMIDFPADELKPLSSILKLMSQDVYECFGLFEEDTLKAYALLSRQKDGEIFLLDYLAVCKAFRNQNYGSQFLALLKKHYVLAKGLIIEIESLRCAKDEEDLLMRTKRLAFYERNGLIQTGVITNCFGVEFTILYMPLAAHLEDALIAQHLDGIYHTLFPGTIYTENVRFLTHLPH